MPRTLRLVTFNLQRAIHCDQIREHVGASSVFRLAEIVVAQGTQVPPRIS
jgi:hypothetical protein